MEWVNAVVLIGLLVFALQQKKRLKGLEENLPLRKSKPESQTDMWALHKDILASYKEVLASEKDILASLKEMVAHVTPEGEGATPSEPKGEDKVTAGAVEQKQRKERAEEKSRFEKEVQERVKTIEWYEKEFAVGLDALLELFLHVPLGDRESIISKMPHSVIKKGFQRLSDKGLSASIKAP